MTVITNAGGPGVITTDEIVTAAASWRRSRPRPWRSTTRSCRRVVAQQPRGRAGRRASRDVREGAAGGGRGPRERRHAGDPDAAVGDEADGDGRGAGQVRAHRGQARVRVVDGRQGAGEGPSDPARRGHPRVRVPRRGGEDLQLLLGVQPQPERAVRGAEDAAAQCGPRGGAQDHREGFGGGPQPADGERVEAAAGELRHPRGADGGVRHGGEGDGDGGVDEVPRGGEAELRDDHPQVRRGRRAAEHPRQGGRAQRVEHDPQQPGEAGQAGGLPGRDGAAPAEPERRLRANLRLQPGQPGGPRDCLRHGRARWWRCTRTRAWRCRR